MFGTIPLVFLQACVHNFVIHMEKELPGLCSCCLVNPGMESRERSVQKDPLRSVPELFACSSVDSTTKVSGEARKPFSFQNKILSLGFYWKGVKGKPRLF